MAAHTGAILLFRPVGSWYINNVLINSPSQTVYTSSPTVAFKFVKAISTSDSLITANVQSSGTILVTLTNSAVGTWTGSYTFTAGTYNLTLNIVIGTTIYTLGMLKIAVSGSLPPPPVTYTLTVLVENNNQNVAGVAVSVSGGYSGITGAGGSVALVLSPGTYTVSISYQGKSQSKTVDLNSDQQLVFDVSPSIQPNSTLEYVASILVAVIVLTGASIITVTRRRPY
jgi:hypothetical protein